MKKIFGLLLVAVIIIFSTSLMANAESITLTNKGDDIELTNAIIESDGTYYISLDDLNAINIGYAELDEYTLLLGKLNGYYKCYVYLEDKIMDGNETYENAVLVQDEITYVSLNAIANDYSISDHTIIDNSTDTISLWINDYTVDSYWLNYKVDENIEIGEEGFTVDLYYGSRQNVAINVGAGGRALPEAKFGVDMTSYPSDSDVHDLDYTTIKDRITHTFTNENRKYTWSYDITKRAAISNGGISSNSGSSGSGGASLTGPVAGGSSSGVSGGGSAASNSSSVFGFIVDDEKYMGGIQAYYSNTNTATVILDKDDVVEYVTVSGTVSVPTQETDLGYHIIAEGNRVITKTANGNYRISRKHVDSSFGTIEAGSSTSTYELKLVPNQDYEIYVRFENGKYVRQFIGYENLTENKVWDFENFEKSKTITGTIKLPDDITTLTALAGSTVEIIDVELTLQSDTAPYYIISKTGFALDLENRTCDFTLVDDMDLGNGYVYFRLYGLYKEVYSAGVYVSNEKTGYTINEANVVSSGTSGLVLTLAKGKVIETVIDYTAENYTEGDNYVLIQEDADNKLDYNNCPLYVYGDRINTEYDLDNVYCRVTYDAVIPYDKTEYVSCLLMNYGSNEYPLYYDTETSTWIDEFLKSDILTSTTLTEVFEGYRPAIAVEVEGNLDGTEPIYYGDFITVGDFDYTDATRYIAYYGENNKLLHVESSTKDYQAGHISYEDIKLDATYYPLSKEIKMFIWHDGLKPIAEVTIVK